MKTVLVVDDDETIRKLVHRALSKRGWIVLEAEDGVDGVGRFLLHRPDVLLTDLSMPRSDGVEMIRTLYVAGELDGVRLVLMSGVLHLTEAVAEKTKAHAMLCKPFTLEQLYVAVGDANEEG